MKAKSIIWVIVVIAILSYFFYNYFANSISFSAIYVQNKIESNDWDKAYNRINKILSDHKFQKYQGYLTDDQIILTKFHILRYTNPKLLNTNQNRPIYSMYNSIRAYLILFPDDIISYYLTLKFINLNHLNFGNLLEDGQELDILQNWIFDIYNIGEGNISYSSNINVEKRYGEGLLSHLSTTDIVGSGFDIEFSLYDVCQGTFYLYECADRLFLNTAKNWTSKSNPIGKQAKSFISKVFSNSEDVDYFEHFVDLAYWNYPSAFSSFIFRNLKTEGTKAYLPSKISEEKFKIDALEDKIKIPVSVVKNYLDELKNLKTRIQLTSNIQEANKILLFRGDTFERQQEYIGGKIVKGLDMIVELEVIELESAKTIKSATCIGYVRFPFKIEYRYTIPTLRAEFPSSKEIARVL